jgi:hypothetical protein
MTHTATGTDYEVHPRQGLFAFKVAAFAGVLLTIVSVWQILEGIAALANDTVFVRSTNYTFEFDVTAWGWIHVIVGLIGLGTGILIVMGQTVGWLMGIFIAAMSTVSSFMFMPYYPFWSLMVIALDVLVIWALCRQIADDRV